MPEASKLNVRRISLQERTLPVGNVVGINGYRVNKATLRKSIEDEGYVIHETPHFFVVIRSVFPIIAVPYEHGRPETVYGHEQIFSQAKLEEVGRWCLQQWNGEGTMRYENCADGLLVIERIKNVGSHSLHPRGASEAERGCNE